MTRRSDHESTVLVRVLGKMEVRHIRSTPASDHRFIHHHGRRWKTGAENACGWGMCFIRVEMVWLHAMPSMCLRPWSSESLPLDAALLVGVWGSLGEVLERSLRVSLDGLASFCPICRADLSIFVLDRNS